MPLLFPLKSIQLFYRLITYEKSAPRFCFDDYCRGVALTYQGITYTTTEKAVDIGPIQITAERRHTLPALTILGGIAIVGGVVLFFVSRRNT